MNIGVLDPTRNQHLKRYPDGTWNKEAIVELDIKDLTIADFLVAYTPNPSVGTSMEIIFTAYTLKKPVYIVCDDLGSISPWTEYFATKLFDNFEELITYIKNNM